MGGQENFERSIKMAFLCITSDFSKIRHPLEEILYPPLHCGGRVGLVVYIEFYLVTLFS